MTTKSAIAATLIIAATMLLGLNSYTKGTRYHIQSTGRDLTYKLDRKTGQIWLIFGGREKLIAKDTGSDKALPPEERALNMAKSAFTLGKAHKVDDAIRMMLQAKKGVLKISGWKAEKKGENIYVVSYIFKDGSGENGFFFEVNLRAEIVRSVLGDTALEKQYGLEEIGKRFRSNIMNKLSPQLEPGHGI